jgi:hypothetical protein
LNLWITEEDANKTEVFGYKERLYRTKGTFIEYMNAF